MRTVFSRLSEGDRFYFLGNTNQFIKCSDFMATGYKNGGSFIISALYGDFSVDAIVDLVHY